MVAGEDLQSVSGSGGRPIVWTIVVAAGSGTRFGGPVPKQFIEIEGQRLVDLAVEVAASVSDGVVVVTPPGGIHGVPAPEEVVVRATTGGASRSESVRCGLAAVDDRADIVVVHDAARPLASHELFARVIAAVVDGADGAVPTIPVVDTLRDVDGAPVDRSRLEAVQTPQGFTRSALIAAHATADDATDDATLVTRCGGQVVAVAGERWNLKVTEPSDELVATAIIKAHRRGDLP